jgi:hypothetical protein
MKFYYMDGNKKVYLTLKRAAPEWCNLDCPNIFIEDKSAGGRWPGWRLLTRLVLEDGNEDLKDKARKFIALSSEAFYKKYPACRSRAGVNGFLENFDRRR